MSIPVKFKDKLRLPLIAAPMFLVSGPELVIAACRQGIIGTFPALNQRDTLGFSAWLEQISSALHDDKGAAAYGVNLIVHNTNPRLQPDLALCVEHKVPLVITSLGAVTEVVDAVHSYGGLVFHDVINMRHAQKAAAAGVDGLIAVCAGAGGHAGLLSPFAFVSEIRNHFDQTVVLAGSLNRGQDILAAEIIGADLAYMGTRFICTQESMADEQYKSMIVSSNAADIVYTDKVSGIFANFLKPSLAAAGVDPDSVAKKAVDLASELDASGSKAWKDIWSAGHGVGGIKEIPTTASLVTHLIKEYELARARTRGG